MKCGFVELSQNKRMPVYSVLDITVARRFAFDTSIFFFYFSEEEKKRF